MAMSEEHKAKMAEGRRRALEKAREVRQANLAAKRARQAEVSVLPPEAIEEIKQVMQVPKRFEKIANPLAGITDTDCCIDCTMDRCVISGKPYCAHPKKCGLSSMDKVNPDAIQRYNAARKALLHAEVNRQP